MNRWKGNACEEINHGRGKRVKTILDQVYTVHTVYMYMKATLRTPLERRVARRAGLLFFRV